jgi:uncharacterized protein YjbI with pentapeptide repeats
MRPERGHERPDIKTLVKILGMADPEHLEHLRNGAEVWNTWRQEWWFREVDMIGLGAGLVDPDPRVDLTGADLEGVDLAGADLRKVDLAGAVLWKADLSNANLSQASLRYADVRNANLQHANLEGAHLAAAYLIGTDFRRANCREAFLSRALVNFADLSESDWSFAEFRGSHLDDSKLQHANLTAANLRHASLGRADLSDAILRGADLSNAVLTGSCLKRADLTGCRVHGISAWDLDTTDAIQNDLLITLGNEPEIRVDRLEIAQFIYLLLNNVTVRSFIETITSKVVLILGRFTPERKAVLEDLKTELRGRGYVSILFDFDRPATRDTTETVSTLAHMARFVIADITDAKSIPQELTVIVPNLPSVPVLPLLMDSRTEYGMFEHFKRFPWVLPTVNYHDCEDLLRRFEEEVIAPLEARARSIRSGNSFT